MISLINTTFIYLWGMIDFLCFFAEAVHPFSLENIEIFNKVDFNKYQNGVKILDVGCGAGIFSIIALMNNKDIKIDELVLTDIDQVTLNNSYQNLLYLKEFFKIEKITFIQSNLLDELKENYYNYFDIVLANLPQTPSKNKIRSDKHGGTEGVELYVQLFKDIKLYTKKNFTCFILHISLSYPKKLEEKLKEFGLVQKIIYEQKRTLNPEKLEELTKGLKDYFLQLNNEKKYEFRIENENEGVWNYLVWLKKIEIDNFSNKIE